MNKKDIEKIIKEQIKIIENNEKKYNLDINDILYSTFEQELKKSNLFDSNFIEELLMLITIDISIPIDFEEESLLQKLIQKLALIIIEKYKFLNKKELNSKLLIKIYTKKIKISIN